MAEPTAVNDQITDSVTDANGKVIAEAPAEAMGQLYLSLAHAAGLAAENAAIIQQQDHLAAQAATTAAVARLLRTEGDA